MTNNEIKSEIEKLSAEIKISRERMDVLRNNCPHDEVSQGVYSWREGSDACGHPVQKLGSIHPDSPTFLLDKQD